MPNPVLAVSGLSISFRTRSGHVKVVDDVSFDVAERETLCVVGESGSGKTVTLLSVLGLLDGAAAISTGSARYKGQEILNQPQSVLRRIRGREIGLISQDSLSALTPVRTIGSQIVEQLREHTDLSRHGARARAIELLGEVGIPNPKLVMDRYPHQLSGGMRQRTVIAMALSCQPSLVIADEPTTALDVTVQAQILELMRRLGRDFGTSVILITHDMGVVAEMADRVLVMYGGRVVERGTRDDIFLNPWHPYTWGLIGSIPPLDGPRPARLVSIPGAPPQPGRWPMGCVFSPRCSARMEACSEPPPVQQARRHESRCFLAPGDRLMARAAELHQEQSACS